MEMEQDKAGAVMRAELQDLKLEMARNRAAHRELFERGQAQLQLEHDDRTRRQELMEVVPPNAVEAQ